MFHINAPNNIVLSIMQNINMSWQMLVLSSLVRLGPNVRFASLWGLFATGYQFTRHQI